MARKKTEAALDKAEKALELGMIGQKAGGTIGAALGGLTGLIIGDRNLVFPLDMIAIPAYQAYLLDSQIPPQFSIYIRAGESLVPTGGNVDDMEDAASNAFEDALMGSVTRRDAQEGTQRKRTLSAYQKRYKAAFKAIAPKFKKKDGTWRTNGFSRAVKAAHAKARGLQ